MFFSSNLLYFSRMLVEMEGLLLPYKRSSSVQCSIYFRYPFTGKMCSKCQVTTCENGGVFNATACRCTCPQGFGGLDCSCKYTYWVLVINRVNG